MYPALKLSDLIPKFLSWRGESFLSSTAVTIRDVKVILTQPPGQPRLVVVKVLTSEPGLYGVGCATFTQRHHAVAAAIKYHLKPFMLGREISRIEELWQMAMVHGYWRNGPVLQTKRFSASSPKRPPAAATAEDARPEER